MPWLTLTLALAPTQDDVTELSAAARTTAISGAPPISLLHLPCISLAYSFHLLLTTYYLVTTRSPGAPSPSPWAATYYLLLTTCYLPPAPRRGELGVAPLVSTYVGE